MKKLYTAFISIILWTSCSDSFLDLSDHSTLSPANYPGTITDMENIVTTVYAKVISFELYGKRAMTKNSFIIDHTADLAYVADPYWNSMALNNIGADNNFVQTLWWGYYMVVQAANIIIYEAEHIDQSLFSSGEKSRLQQMIGEGYFWRAWGHQQLIQFWGEGFPVNGDSDKQGIPIRLNPATSIEQLNAERNTVGEVYDQIIKDYGEAEKLLPEAWSKREDFSRPTKYSAKSFLGQTYLYMGKYDESKTELKNVIENSGKTLVAFDEYKEMFNENQTKFNNESILEINLKDGSSSGWGNWAGGEGSMHAFVASLCYATEDGGVNAAGWGNIYFHDANIERFGNDPRLHIAAIEPGTPIVMSGEATVVAKYKLDGVEIADLKGWSLRKYVPLSYNTYDVSCCVGINMFLMRAADVYLMYAEACQASGDEETARTYVNLVRRRAYQGDTSYDIHSSGTQLRDDIREERFRELCAEGVQHWVDVARWKTLEEEIQRWYTRTAVGAPRYSDKSLYLPIPQREIEDNSNMTQSKGY